jgi:hypothetical protein
MKAGPGRNIGSVRKHLSGKDLKWPVMAVQLVSVVGKCHC